MIYSSWSSCLTWKCAALCEEIQPEQLETTKREKRATQITSEIG